MKRIVLLLGILASLMLFAAVPASAQSDTAPAAEPPATSNNLIDDLQGGQELLVPFVDLSVREPQSGEEVALSLQLLLLLTVLSLAPSIFIMMTSFLRIAIVFDFVKRALSLQQVPRRRL
jgi:flagellar biosynthetic protein FliP